MPFSNLFAYGSLVFPEIMQAVAGRAFAGIDAVLPGYRCCRIKGCDYPGIIPAPGFLTPGRIYQDIDPIILARLDRFEGGSYLRAAVEAVGVDGERFRAFAYVVRDDQRHILVDQPWNPADYCWQDFVGLLEG